MSAPAGEPLIPPVALAGAGKMGGAMFAGWCRAGLAPSLIIDPSPMPGLARPDDMLAATPDQAPPGFVAAVLVLAVKPQIAPDLLPALRRLIGPDTVVLSIMAGRRIAGLSAALGGAPVVRAMPNTPAAIGQGVSGICAGPGVSAAQFALCRRLLSAVGEVAELHAEDEIDVVTAVSGSGPAYVFLLAEILEQIACEQGLAPAEARKLARATVSGAGALLAASAEDSAALRRAVTSPKGTTEQALAVLMAEGAWPRNLREAIAANMRRAAELSA